MLARLSARDGQNSLEYLVIAVVLVGACYGAFQILGKNLSSAVQTEINYNNNPSFGSGQLGASSPSNIGGGTTGLPSNVVSGVMPDSGGNLPELNPNTLPEGDPVTEGNVSTSPPASIKPELAALQGEGGPTSLNGAPLAQLQSSSQATTITSSKAKVFTMLTKAWDQIGVHEVPADSNSGPTVLSYIHSVHPELKNNSDWCNFWHMAQAPGCDHVAWCAAFVSWAAAQAGIAIYTNGRGTLYVPDYQAWAAREGLWRKAGATVKPTMGNLVVFTALNDQGDLVYSHIGIVSAVSTTTFSTVEGNTWKVKKTNPDMWVTVHSGIGFGNAHVAGYIDLASK
jgi:hypothetical protein